MTRALLQGNEMDLKVLAVLFTADPSVVCDPADGRYYLHSDKFDQALHADPAAPVVDMALEMLSTMNGIARLQDRGHDPVQLGGEFDQLPDGVAVGGNLRVYRASFRGFSEDFYRPDRAFQMIQLAAGDLAVRTVLLIFARPRREIDWYELYKVYEWVEHDVGRAQLEAWFPKAKVKEFRDAANYWEFSGDSARHPRLAKGRVPADPEMTRPDATAFVTELVNRWLDEKLVHP